MADTKNATFALEIPTIEKIKELSYKTHRNFSNVVDWAVEIVYQQEFPQPETQVEQP